jgi:hypothetical protein
MKIMAVISLKVRAGTVALTASGGGAVRLRGDYGVREFA